MTREMIEIENVLQQGKIYRVDAKKFEAMRKAFLSTVPSSRPGLKVDEIKKKLLPLLPQDLFPGGEKAGWWLKSVQLDQEAKGIVAREDGAPVRLYLVE